MLDITTGLQVVSATGAVPGTLDTSALTGTFTVFVRVAALGANKTVTIAIEDTANASAFSDAVQLATFTFSGIITPDAEVIRSLTLPYGVFEGATMNDMAGCTVVNNTAARYGVANGKLRINVTSATASPGLSVHAYVTTR